MPKLMHNWFKYNRQKTTDLGLHIERVPNQDRPERKYDRYSVPGRTGDIFVYQDAYENVDQTYEVWGGDGTTNSATALGYTLSDWLYSKNGDGPNGYELLTDSYDPDHFRWATFTGPFDLESQLTRRGRATLTFSCDPRRFLSASANEWVEFLYADRPWTITNPTRYTAKPAFDLVQTGGGPVTIECGGKTLSISNAIQRMFIDCERMIAEDEHGQNVNYLLSGDFPVIEPGAQTITVTGNLSILGVLPLWWEL